jgi:hypothetical protein
MVTRFSRHGFRCQLIRLTLGFRWLWSEFKPKLWPCALRRTAWPVMLHHSMFILKNKIKNNAWKKKKS